MLLKFRTMYVGADTGADTTSKFDKRITNVGYYLRKFNSDDPVRYDFALFGLGVFEKF